MRRSLLVMAGVLGVLAVAIVSPAGAVAAETANETAPSDPETDVLGWENGYWYNESISVDQSDGLSTAERERLLARTMARVEHLRGLEFDDTPRIEFVSREGVQAYVEQNVTQLPGGDQLWEAMFVFGEDTDARAAVGETILASVAGMAAEEGVDHIVLVTDDPEQPRASGFVLAHELVHVLQDQHFDLSADRYRRSTLDGELAKDGLVEGEASLVDGLYRRNCVSGQWSCLTGGTVSPSGPSTPAVADLMAVPYQQGARYATALRERGGWKRVSDTHKSPPSTMKPVLHPDRDAGPSAAIAYADRSSPGWDRTAARQRIGEAGIRTLFERQQGARGVSLPHPGDTERPGEVVDALADGWANDTLYGYTNGTHEGYVWVTEWESPADAEAFAVAYRAVLEHYESRSVGTSQYVVPDGPFADAFALRRDGTRVTIGNAPDRAALRKLSDRFEATPTAPATRTTGTSADGTPATTASGPGFSPVLSVLALVVLASVAARRRPSGCP